MQIVSIGSMSRNSLVNNQVKLCHVIKRVRKICAHLNHMQIRVKKKANKKIAESAWSAESAESAWSAESAESAWSARSA